MRLLREVWASLDPVLQQNQELLLSKLDIKLQEAVRLIEGIVKNKQNPTTLLNVKGRVKKGKYTLWVKDSLNHTVAEFAKWHRLFDPSWLLLSRVESEKIDRCLDAKDGQSERMIQALSVLRKAARDLTDRADQPSRDISSRDFLGPRIPIANSVAAIAQFEGSNNFAIVDTMALHFLTDIGGTNRDIKGLCKALYRMDPFLFGLLRCCGVINRSRKLSFGDLLAYDLVFEIPTGLRCPPQSLRNLLRNTRPSLNLKLEMAKHLAASVFYLHTTGFVHKNIRPETILLFEQEESSAKLLCLVGFEKFREARGVTSLRGDGQLEREFYRHPLRQGYDPTMKYIMQHDIYSLGVCLLEMCLWISFINEHVPQGGSVLHDEFSVDGLLAVTDERRRAFGIKKKLVSIAEERLPPSVGQRLTDTVVNCLTCLDGPESWDHFEEDGSQEVNVGVQFIENVLVGLHEIVV